MITVTVNPLPVVTASSSPASPLCEGESLTLTGGGATYYTWTDGTTTYTDGLAFIPAVGTVTYTVTGTDASTSCTNNDMITVTVNPLPVVTASSSPASPLCEGDYLTLNGAGATYYTWTDGTTTYTDGLAFIPAVGTVTYTVTGIDINSCTNNDMITVTVTPAPTAIISQNVVDLEIIVSGGGSPYIYQWNTTATTQSITPLTNGTYWCLVTDDNGCIADTAFFEVTNISTSITEIKGRKTLLKITNTLGQETPYRRNTPLFYIYDDGSVEKHIIIE